MAFDASRGGPRDPAPTFKHAPIDWLDWGLRIVVFVPLMGLYLYWIWTILEVVLGGLFTH